MSYATNETPSALSGELAGTAWFNAADAAYGATYTDTSINAAIAAGAATSTAKFTVFIPPGTWTISNRINLVSNMTLFAYPNTVTLKTANNVTTTTILGLNVSNVSIIGLGIDLNSSGTTNAGSSTGQLGIYIQSTTANVTGIVIRDVTIVNGWQYGIRLNANTPTGTYRLDVAIEDCDISACLVGIRAFRGTGVKIRHNRVHSNTNEGINCLGGSNDSIEENDCYSNGGQGIVINSSTDLSVYASIVGNHCYLNGADSPGNLGWGINVSDRSSGFVVANNVCEYNYQGGITVDVVQAGFAANLQTTNGSVTGNTIIGFSGSNASNGISTNKIDGLAIVGNTIIGQSNNGILLDGRGGEVEGNVLRNNGTYGINVTYSVTTPTMISVPHVVGPNMYDNNTSGTLNVNTSFGSSITLAPQAADIQTFAGAPAAANPATQGTGTWTKPVGSSFTTVRCIAIGGGAGGGSGGAVAAPTACTGGGGGGGAGRTMLEAPISEFLGTETVKIGGGGLGGSGVASGDGNAGANGALSTMTKNGVIFCVGRSGNGGGAGKGSGTASAVGSGGVAGSSGGNGATSIAAGTVAATAANAQAGGGGGAGGGVTAAIPGATAAGGAGAQTGSYNGNSAGGGAGSGAGGGAGTAPTDWSASDALPGGGGGGGGSESDSSHNGGAGANGGLYGGGGGGGGACRPTGTTGAGGNGAGGIVVVVSF